MKTRRVYEVSALLKQMISNLIVKDLPEDMGIVTVIDVIVTNDLKLAKVYISVIDQNKELDVLDFLVKHTKQFQHYLGKNLKMKFTPKLEFIIDKYQDDLNRVEKLYEEIEHGT